jgi:hypothetical protein
MIEIEFRGQTINGEWVFGLLAIKDKKYYISNKAGAPFAFEVRPETVGQYTGLNDDSDCLLDSQEDKKVYAGDIVSVGYENKVVTACVKFDMGTFILISDEFADGWIPIYKVANQDRDYEWINGIVIGNIHDNAELLKGVE